MIFQKCTITLKSSKMPCPKLKCNLMSNGWKTYCIRNKCYVDQNSIWALEINENWTWSVGCKTCICVIFQNWPKFKPFCLNDASSKWQNLQYESCISFQGNQFALKFCIIWIFDEEVMGTWSWTFSPFNAFGPTSKSWKMKELYPWEVDPKLGFQSKWPIMFWNGWWPSKIQINFWWTWKLFTWF